MARVASSVDAGTTVNACVEGAGGGTAGDHAAMVPSSVLKMNRAGPEFVPSVTTKPAPPLKTMPVGALGGSSPAAGGTDTTRAFAFPEASYSVESPVPLSFTHQKPVGLNCSPQALP